MRVALSLALLAHGVHAASKLDPSGFDPDLLLSASDPAITLGLPEGFIWGTATAAYQVEGGYDQDGKGESIWDAFSHEKGRISHADTGDIADDHYNRYREDIELQAEMGMTHYRLSISWGRIMPTGELPLNQAGIDHYNEVFDTLREFNMEPFVTIYHWDLPLALETKYGGWLSPNISDIFAVYAEECFKAFGDKVTNWLTFNEPWTFARHGYSAGFFPPGRCSDRNVCDEGDSGTETYMVGHNVLRSHAKAAGIYLDKYAAEQKGEISMTVNCDWVTPMTGSESDIEAAERFVEFQLGWYTDPMFKGHYPPAMVERLGDRLPSFTEEESALLLRTSPPWLGLNHYSTSYARDRRDAQGLSGESLEEMRVSDLNADNGWDYDHGAIITNLDTKGQPIGVTGESAWLHVVPWGFRRILNWVHERYAIPIIITENGCDVPNESVLGLPLALSDPFRINYHAGYIAAMSDAVREDGVDVRGYFAWSFMDNFEWADGYSKRFGLVYVDYTTLERLPKASALWYTTVAKIQQGLLFADSAKTDLGAHAHEEGGSDATETTSHTGSVIVLMVAVCFVAGVAVFLAMSYRRAGVRRIGDGTSGRSPLQEYRSVANVDNPHVEYPTNGV